MGGAARPREHDGHGLAGIHRRVRAVPQPQVRPVLAARLLPPARVLRQRRVLGIRQARRSDHFIQEPTLDLPSPEQASPARRADRRNWPRSTRRSARQAPRSTPARPAWEAAQQAAVSAWTTLQPERVARRRGDAGRPARRLGAGLGPSPRTRRIRGGRHRAGRPNHRPPTRGAARPLAAQGRTGPRSLRQLRAHRVCRRPSRRGRQRHAAHVQRRQDRRRQRRRT